MGLSATASRAPDNRLVEVRDAGDTIARSQRSCKLMETASPPTFYLPQDDVNWDFLIRRTRHVCVRVERCRGVLGSRKKSAATGCMELPSTARAFRYAQGLCRVLPGATCLFYRWRARAPVQAGSLLRWLDNVRAGRAIQGRTRHGSLVSIDCLRNSRRQRNAHR